MGEREREMEREKGRERGERERGEREREGNEANAATSDAHCGHSLLLVFRPHQEKRIFDLKKKNQELEKFRFVLDYKIKVGDCPAWKCCLPPLRRSFPGTPTSLNQGAQAADRPARGRDRDDAQTGGTFPRFPWGGATVNIRHHQLSFAHTLTLSPRIHPAPPLPPPAPSPTPFPQVEEMNLELEQYHKSNLALNLMIEELKLKLEGLRRELLSQKERAATNTRVQVLLVGPLSSPLSRPLSSPLSRP